MYLNAVQVSSGDYFLFLDIFQPICKHRARHRQHAVDYVVGDTYKL